MGFPEQENLQKREVKELQLLYWQHENNLARIHQKRREDFNAIVLTVLSSLCLYKQLLVQTNSYDI